MNQVIICVKKIIPSPLKPAIRSILFWIKYGFPPPPKGTDLVGYEVLLDELKKHRILDIEGDFVEIGSFVGGGTYKLSRYLSRAKSHKKLIAIDVFDITKDFTQNTQGQAMYDIYASILKGRDQFEVFCEITKGCSNIIVVKGDSKEVTLPTEKIAFAFIDGNHDPFYVSNDFYLIWSKLSVGGIVAFDDYGYDLPMVTSTINKLLEKHMQDIDSHWVKGKVIFIKKGKRN